MVAVTKDTITLGYIEPGEPLAVDMREVEPGVVELYIHPWPPEPGEPAARWLT